jgi:glycosyltransferase involved in cell wall biosynthesis
MLNKLQEWKMVRRPRVGLVLSKSCSKQRLTVVIPTLNEIAYLPGLLDALNAQTLIPDEVIVADAGSTDGTVELAQARGARVVRGGMPAAGRNAGARVAGGDLLIFLDADVLPPPDFIARSLEEFEFKHYDVATCFIAALDKNPLDRILSAGTNLYFRVIQPISPHAPGFCILSRRIIHEKMGGFNESLILSEDIDYARRAKRYGNFGILSSTHIPVSMRRVEKEGLVSLGLKYAWCEMYALAGKPVRSLPFKYEFGAFDPPQASVSRSVMDLGKLRQHWVQFSNPLQLFNRSGWEQLNRWMEMDTMQLTRERIRRLPARRDLDPLNCYLQARLAFVPQTYEQLNEYWSKIKTLPKEKIALLGSNRRRLPRPDDTDTGANRTI